MLSKIFLEKFSKLLKATLLIVFILNVIIPLSNCFASDEISFDLYLENRENKGIGLNVDSDSYQPFEEVEIHAILKYNYVPRANKFVSFQVIGPESDNQIIIFRSSKTDNDGIASLKFRIPPSAGQGNEQAIGEWNIMASTELVGVVKKDTLSFNVKWHTEIYKIETYDDNRTISNVFLREENLNIALHINKTVNNIENIILNIDLKDNVGQKITNKTELLELTDSITIIEETILLESEYPIGNCTVEVTIRPLPYPDSYPIPKKTHTIEIKNRIIVFRMPPISESLMEGSVFEIDYNVQNLGSEIETINILFLSDSLVFLDEVINVLPNSEKNNNIIFNSTDLREGNYTIHFKLIEYSNVKEDSKLLNNINLGMYTNSSTFYFKPNKDYSILENSDSYQIGFIEVKYPSVTQMLVTSFTYIISMTGITSVSAFITYFLKKR